MNKYGQINWESIFRIGAAGGFSIGSLVAMLFNQTGWMWGAFLIACIIIFFGIDGAISSLAVYSIGFILSFQIIQISRGICILYAIIIIALIIARRMIVN